MLAIVDIVVALGFFAYALTQHVLPSFASAGPAELRLPPRSSTARLGRIVVTLLVLLGSGRQGEAGAGRVQARVARA